MKKIIKIKNFLSAIIIISIFCGIVLYHIIKLITPPKYHHSTLPLEDQLLIDEMLHPEPPEPYLGRYGDPK